VHAGLSRGKWVLAVPAVAWQVDDREIIVVSRSRASSHHATRVVVSFSRTQGGIEKYQVGVGV
jgi:hypothetical protein